MAADDGVVVMPPRSLHHHHVAIDDGATIQKTSLDEVMDKIVLIQGFLIVAPSGMVERRRSGAKPDRRGGFLTL
jgi:hypothetical protein